ncbi:MAG: cytochrome c3 family protein [Planctomycetota bacterium]|jgi:predicted CXXCH cytochrome family protein
MKTRTTLLLVAGAAVVGWVGVAIAGPGPIVGSAHDFRDEIWNDGEICKPCHTPHFANKTDDGETYLWAHDLSSATYTLYDHSVSLPGGADLLDKYSRMCLSCHDGTIALNAYHNGGGVPEYIPDAYKVGGDGDLTDDHPIGLAAPYDLDGAAGRWEPATESPSGYWGFGPGFFPEIPLFPFEGEEVVSCSTCHTPHAKEGISHLLRKDNIDSDLCLTCHIK